MSINSAADFFETKKKWSYIKDNLLAWYLAPYLSKIFMATNDFYLIDGFSGPGLFEDKKEGSPLIEAKILNESFKKTNNKNLRIHLICVEKDKLLFKKLVQNTRSISFIECINGSIETVLPNILAKIEKKAAVFLYLDPFGIKGIPLDFSSLLFKRKDLKIEMLLNFNSFGCYRECKRLIGDGDFDEYFEDNKYLLDTKSTISRMNVLLGTEQWQNFINLSNPEYRLSIALCEKFKKSFKYVLNMPIKGLVNDSLKYRMIHCTNSASGAILMAENMLLQMEKNKVSLFNTDLEGNIVDVNKTVLKVIDLIPEFPEKPIKLNELMMCFYETFGVICQPKTLKDLLRRAELDGNISVTRIPSYTANGQATRFWSEDSGKEVKIVKKVIFG